MKIRNIVYGIIFMLIGIEIQAFDSLYFILGWIIIIGGIITIFSSFNSSGSSDSAYFCWGSSDSNDSDGGDYGGGNFGGGE